ncbi:MAG: hypothetical protein CL840_18100 [Crocinitomicaceae bacterium]|nr:hypothetical protein [Crocinitomicaceae bacterium]|tara:strand:- start:22278 stop:22847 length:570 start_codon:yes stop_codon:yes gene_type:complete
MLNKDLNNLSEAELLNLFYESKNRKALGILLNRYLPHIFAVCHFYLKNRPKAKDACSDVIEKMILYFSKNKVSSAKALIMISAKNHCLSLLKRNDNNRSIEEVMEIANEENEMDLLIQKNATLDQLHECLEELKPDQRNNIKQFYIERKSYQEIARESGQSLNKIKSSLQNGKRMLRSLMMNKMSHGNK